MKKRNLFMIVTAAAMVLMAAGCSRTEVETTAAATTAAATEAATEAAKEEETTTVQLADQPDAVDGQHSQAPVGLVNPMASYDSLEEVNEKIGSSLAKPEKLDVTDEAFFTIQGTPMLGEYDFKVGDTEYSLRAGRTMGDISGIYLPTGDTAGIALDMEYYPGADGTLQTDDGIVGRFFEYEYQYVLFARDAKDEKAFAEVMDELKYVVQKQTAATLDEHIVAPLWENVGNEGKLDDWIIPAELLVDSLDKLEDTYVIRATLYTEDLYDSVEVNKLEKGDKLIYDSNLIVVEEIEKEGGAIVVNGGLDQGGCMLVPDEGGTYVAQEWDDYPTYSCKGTYGLNIAEDAVMNDRADIENPEKYLDLKGEELIERLQSKDYSFNERNTKLHIVDNSIQEIERIYTP